MGPPASPASVVAASIRCVLDPLMAELQRRVEKVAEGKARPEDVRRLRAAARRIAVLVEEFAAPGRSGEHHLHVLERLRKRAGKVRDRDVALGLIEAAVPRSAAFKLARRALKRHLRTARDASVRKLRQELTRLRIGRFRKALAKMAAGVVIDPAGAGRVIRRNTARALALARGAAAHPQAADRLHRTRLAIKRVRDLVDLCGARVEGSSALARRAARLVIVLGKAQDRVVMLQLIGKLEGDAGGKVRAGLHAIERIFTSRHLSAQKAALAALARAERDLRLKVGRIQAARRSRPTRTRP